MQHVVILRVKPDTDEEQLAMYRKAEAAKVWELMKSEIRSLHSYYSDARRSTSH
jgi:hypothetical protein